jgi:phosphoribosyl-AMP cyclohydrolase
VNRIEIEEGDDQQLDFAKLAKVARKCPDVIPVAVQNIDTGEVLVIAYVNREALEASLKSRTAVFWSTSRNELWEKGKTSGEVFDLIEVYVNCEQNSLLYKVRPRRGGMCHTKNSQGIVRNCYYRKLDMDSGKLQNLDP